MIAMKKTSHIVVWCMMMAFLHVPVHASAISAMPQSGSFEFQNTTVSEALQEIGRGFDITIYAPFDQLNEKVTKSYKGARVEEIINDMMRRQDHAIVWYYRDHKIVALEIQIAEGKGTRYTSSRQTDNTAAARGHLRDSGRDSQGGHESASVFSKRGDRKATEMNAAAGRREPGDASVPDDSPGDTKNDRSGSAGINRDHDDIDSRTDGQARLNRDKDDDDASAPPSPRTRDLPEGLEPPPAPPGM